MEINLYIAALIAVLILIPIAYILILSNAKEMIRDDLQSKGAKDIIVRYEWFDFDRDTTTFSVEFTNAGGTRCTTRCKVHRWGILLSNEIYWSSNLELEPKQADEVGKKLIVQKEGLPTSEISSILPVFDSEDMIVMMKYITAFRNVFRCKPDGSIVWQAELPTETGDVYTNIEWRGEQLTAFSRSCIAVILDVETGKIISPKPRA